MHHAARFFLLVLLSTLISAACAQSGDQREKPKVLFSVNSRNVTTEEFAYLFRKNHPRKEDYTEAKVGAYLDLLVTFKLKVAEAFARGYDTTRSFRKEFSSYRAELRKPYRADQDQLEKLTRQAYERMTLEVRASHLLVSLASDAKPEDTLAAYKKVVAFRDRVINGEDFETLARTFSDDPSARTNGGDLGYFTVMQMVYPFEEAAYGLKTGELSTPVRTRFGYHLIRVTDRRMARGEVEVSHIILRTGTKDDTRVRTKIFEIHSELQAGRSWDELCKEYSDDGATKNSGGRLRPFGIGALSGVPQFEQVAFSLHSPGEISDPFQSAYGWHIVRLERRIPTPPYEQVAESLRRRVSRDERLRTADDRQRARQLSRYGYAANAEVERKLLDYADSTLLKAQWRFKGPTELRGQALFTLDGRPHTVNDFVRYAEQEQEMQSLSPKAALELLMKSFVTSCLDDREDEDLMRDHAEYRNLVNEYREGILLFTIMEKEVWNKAAADTVGLRSYYQANQSSYVSGERVRARIFASDDSAFVTSALKKIQSGDTLTQSDMKRFKSAQGPRNFAPGESKAVDRVPRMMGVHKTKVDATHYLVQVETLVPPGTRSLEEIRAQVISDYQDQLEKAWVKGLRGKYPVKVNTKARKSVIRELTQP